jgi:HK97 gp10 family phage protein
MAVLGFELQGIEELEKAIDRAEKRYDAALRVATNKGAAIVQKAAKENIHSISGELKKHVKRRIWKRKPGFVGVLVGPAFPGATPQQRSYYGKWVEEGHKIEHGTSRVPAHPWLRPALDNNEDRVQKEMEKVFRQATEGKITESDAIAALEELLLGD